MRTLDHSGDAIASFRSDLNITTSWLLPTWSTGPQGDEQTALEAAAALGYQGIQGANPSRCRELGLVPTTFAIQPLPGGLLDQADLWVDLGFECCTILLGTGLEDDAAADVLVEEVLTASSTAGIPLYVETHRATVTQDMWRTVQLVKRFPELRFNGDFSHWYTGQDMAANKFEATLEFIAPVLDRVRYMHGRIGNSGCIQVAVGDGSAAEEQHIANFRALWTRASSGFIAHAANDPLPPRHLQMGFAPELLPAEVDYARLFRTPDGEMREESDRWQQALALTKIARECFQAALSSAKSVS